MKETYADTAKKGNADTETNAGGYTYLNTAYMTPEETAADPDPQPKDPVADQEPGHPQDEQKTDQDHPTK